MTCNYCGWCEEAGVAHDCQQELRRNIASLTAQRDELLAACEEAMLEFNDGYTAEGKGIIVEAIASAKESEGE